MGFFHTNREKCTCRCLHGNELRRFEYSIKVRRILWMYGTLRGTPRGGGPAFARDRDTARIEHERESGAVRAIHHCEAFIHGDR